MKLLLLLPLLFALASASKTEEEILELNRQVLIDALKKIEGTKFELPEEFIEKINLPSANVGARATGITANVDDYVDKVLVQIQNVIVRYGMDPVELPDTTLNLIPTGTITLSSGWLQDTSSIQRNGNTTVGYSSSTKVIQLDLPIKFSSLLVTYKYVTKILLLSIDGDANGKIEDLTINLRLSYDYTTYQATLEYFDITDTGRFSLKFTGNGLLDWMTNTMTSVATLFLQPIVVRIIQAMVKGGLQSIVDAVNAFISSIFTP